MAQQWVAKTCRTPPGVHDYRRLVEDLVLQAPEGSLLEAHEPEMPAWKKAGGRAKLFLPEARTAE